MNIHEYQARQLLGQYGVALPAGEVCDTPEAARAIAAKLLADGADSSSSKSQIHAGGRGKGTFKSGFKGGVKLCKTAEDVGEKAKAMLGNVLVTKQTGPEGRPVEQIARRRRAEYPEGVLSGRAARPLRRRARWSWPAPRAAWTSRKWRPRRRRRFIKEPIDPAPSA